MKNKKLLKYFTEQILPILDEIEFNDTEHEEYIKAQETLDKWFNKYYSKIIKRKEEIEMKKRKFSLLIPIMFGMLCGSYYTNYQKTQTINDQEVTINQLEKAIVDYENYQDEDLKYISDLEDHLDSDHIEHQETLQYIEELEQLLKERGE